MVLISVYALQFFETFLWYIFVAGGSVPVFDEIIISTSLMNKIIDVDETAGKLMIIPQTFRM